MKFFSKIAFYFFLCGCAYKKASSSLPISHPIVRVLALKNLEFETLDTFIIHPTELQQMNFEVQNDLDTSVAVTVIASSGTDAAEPSDLLLASHQKRAFNIFTNRNKFAFPQEGYFDIAFSHQGIRVNKLFIIKFEN